MLFLCVFGSVFVAEGLCYVSEDFLLNVCRFK